MRIAPLAAAVLFSLGSAGALALGKPKEEQPGVQLDKLKVAQGQAVTLFAQGMPKARQMAMGPDGMLFVATNDKKLYVVKVDGGKAAAPQLILKGKHSNGVAYANGALFVADREKILRYDNVAAGNLDKAKPATLISGLPGGSRHTVRFMAVGPDGKLYISVGSPCNVCEAKDDEYGTIIRVNADGSGKEVFARGIRNTVGFDWNPKDGSLWFTENGQDELGPDKPEDELNRVSKAGENFGFPYCHAGNIADPKLGAKHACSEFTAPAVGLGPHSAALGMRFLKSDGSAIIARHGSHPPTLVAYDVVRVAVNGDRAGKPEPYLTGFLQGGSYWGRPADVLPLADGSVLVSDDLNGVIYRVAKN